VGREDTMTSERADPGLGAAPGCLRWPGLAFEKQHVRALGADATCWTIRGDLWSFDRGAFYVTDLRGDRRRRRVWDETLVPQGPWHHRENCDCEMCRLGTA
jgi:hypothetical protein